MQQTGGRPRYCNAACPSFFCWHSGVRTAPAIRRTASPSRSPPSAPPTALRARSMHCGSVLSLRVATNGGKRSLTSLNSASDTRFLALVRGMAMSITFVKRKGYRTNMKVSLIECGARIGCAWVPGTNRTCGESVGQPAIFIRRLESAALAILPILPLPVVQNAEDQRNTA